MCIFKYLPANKAESPDIDNPSVELGSCTRANFTAVALTGCCLQLNCPVKVELKLTLT